MHSFDHIQAPQPPHQAIQVNEAPQHESMSRLGNGGKQQPQQLAIVMASLVLYFSSASR